jgi:hypothetical protein
MKYYDEYDTDDIDVAVGADQLDAEEDDVSDVLNGDFDDIMDMSDDELDSLMDADEDKEDIQDVPESVLAARTLVDECQGVDENGFPKATIALTLEKIDKTTEEHHIVAQQAVWKPIVHIFRRRQFVEISFTFPNATDRDMHVMMTHLDKYGEMVTNDDENNPTFTQLTFVVLPVTALGTFYMFALNPIFWAMQPSEFNGPINQIKMIVDCEDIGFVQTDEIDTASIESSIQRELEIAQSAYANMEAKDAQRKARNEEFNALREQTMSSAFDTDDVDDEDEE